MVKGWSTSGQSLAVYAVGFCRSRRTKKNPACRGKWQAGCVNQEESRAHAKGPGRASSRVTRPTALTYDVPCAGFRSSHPIS